MFFGGFNVAEAALPRKFDRGVGFGDRETGFNVAEAALPRKSRGRGGSRPPPRGFNVAEAALPRKFRKAEPPPDPEPPLQCSRGSVASEMSTSTLESSGPSFRFNVAEAALPRKSGESAGLPLFENRASM